MRATALVLIGTAILTAAYVEAAPSMMPPPQLAATNRPAAIEAPSAVQLRAPEQAIVFSNAPASTGHKRFAIPDYADYVDLRWEPLATGGAQGTTWVARVEFPRARVPPSSVASTAAASRDVTEPGRTLHVNDAPGELPRFRLPPGMLNVVFAVVVLLVVALKYRG